METPRDDPSRPPKDKDELLDRIRKEWNALDRAVTGLSEERMSVPGEGGWSIKDHLSHLAAWERWLRLCYLHHRPGYEVLEIDEPTFQTLDENGINAILQERNQGRPLEEVLTEHRRGHAELLAELNGYSFEDMLKPVDPQDPEQRPLLGWIIGNTYDHYREHRETITKLAGK
jgi:hypothetical protein